MFCKIVEKEIPSSIVYGDSKVIAFLDIKPANKGHVLVIPKKHYVTLIEIPDSTLGEIAKVIKKIGKAVMKVTKAKDFNVVQSNGIAAGQLVMHAHFHVIPRFSGDGLTTGTLSREPLSYDEGEAKELMKRIRQVIAE